VIPTGADAALFDFKRVFVVVSNVCNCRCVMCNNRHHSLGKSQLTFTDVHRIARFAVDNHVDVLDLSGGEPFEFPHIARLIREFGASETTLNIVTNGTIMTGDLVDAIAQAPSLRLQVSTHGLGKVEDDIKALRGAAGKVERTLGLLEDAGVSVSLATVVQRRNLHQLMDIYRHFSMFPASHHSFVMYEPMGDVPPEHIDPDDVRITADRADELREQMMAVIAAAHADGNVINLDPPLVEKYVERVLVEGSAKASSEPSKAAEASTPEPSSAPAKHFSHPGLLCTIPRRNLFIDHTGDVRPCFHFDWQALNSHCSLSEAPIDELVFSPAYREMILTAIGPGGCPGCDAACYIWDPDFRRRATQPNADDTLVAMLAERGAPWPSPHDAGDAAFEGRGRRELRMAEARAAYLEEALRTVELSSSWRITAPLRRLRRLARIARGR